MKDKFEEWLVKQFGKKMIKLLGYDEKKGYLDQAVNAMWIGFNAGYVLANQGEGS